MTPRRQAAMVLSYALSAAPIFITIAMFFVLDPSESTVDPVWVLAVPVVGAAAVHLICETVLYRLPPITAATPPDEATGQALERQQARKVLRFALCELPFLVSLALAFVISSGGFWLVLVGGILGAALIFLHTWPLPSRILREQASLDREGGRSGLAAAYGIEG